MVRPGVFLDFERGLIDRWWRQLQRRWKPVWAEIETAIAREDYFAAHDAVDRLTVDLNPVNSQGARFLTTMGTASMLLGFSRHARPVQRPSEADRDVLAAAVRQLKVMLEDNAAAALRREAHRLLAQLGAGHIEKRDTRTQALRVKIEGRTKSFYALAASLYVSRLSAYGFLVQAKARGLKAYEISAKLDACRLCKVMDGKVFPVPEGLAHAEHVLTLSDPDALKQAAPFFSQSKAAVDYLKRWSIEDLIDEGLNLPPYHPLCRCIVVPTQADPVTSPANASDRLGLAMETLYGVGRDSEPRVEGSPIPVNQVSPALGMALGAYVGYQLVDRLFGQPEKEPESETALDALEEDEDEDDIWSFWRR